MKKKINKLKKLPPKLQITKRGIVELPAEETKAPRFDNKKYIRISENESEDKFRELGERVSKKEIKWIYYAIENFVGVHYYLILKKD